jgi:signal transduction histidine kinase
MVTISDNGKGFNLPQQLSEFAGRGKLGLTGMAERARLIGGELEVSSQIGKGTKLTVRAPIVLHNQINPLEHPGARSETRSSLSGPKCLHFPSPPSLLRL